MRVFLFGFHSMFAAYTSNLEVCPDISGFVLTLQLDYGRFMTKRLAMERKLRRE